MHLTVRATACHMQTFHQRFWSGLLSHLLLHYFHLVQELFLCLCACVFMHVCICLCVYECVYVCACIHVCLHVYAYMCMHFHAYMCVSTCVIQCLPWDFVAYGNLLRVKESSITTVATYDKIKKTMKANS